MTSQSVITRELADLCRRFRQWRAKHPKRYIPKVFWQQAARCAQHTDAKEVARSIGVKLIYLRRKIHLYQPDLLQPPQEDAFVELTLPPVQEVTNSSLPVPICCRLEDGSGRSATIQFEGQVQGLLSVLGQFFGGAN